MKKIITVLIILTLTLTSGCTDSGGSKTIADYFPFTPNVFYEYEGYGHDLASMQFYPGYINGNILQRRTSLTANYPSQTEVFKYENGELRIFYADISAYYIEDVTDISPVMDILILKEPLKVNQEWTMSGSSKSKITSMNYKITVPYGTFTAMEVTTTLPESGFLQKDYYVEGIGLVDTRYSKDGGSEIISSLKSITNDCTVDVSVSAFYPDPANGNISIQEIGLKLSTNGDILKEVERILKAPSPEGNLEPLLAKGRLNGVTVDRAAAAATVDVSAEVYEINESQQAEMDWVYALGNTIGSIYNVDMVAVHVDGGLYTGTFVQFTEGDFIEVEK